MNQPATPRVRMKIALMMTKSKRTSLTGPLLCSTQLNLNCGPTRIGKKNGMGVAET